MKRPSTTASVEGLVHMIRNVLMSLAVAVSLVACGPQSSRPTNQSDLTESKGKLADPVVQWLKNGVLQQNNPIDLTPSDNIKLKIPAGKGYSHLTVVDMTNFQQVYETDISPSAGATIQMSTFAAGGADLLVDLDYGYDVETYFNGAGVGH